MLKLKPKNLKTRQKYKAYLILAFIISLFLILIVRIFQLQITQHDHYRELSFINQLRIDHTPSKRGQIFDRNHIPLAQNNPQVDLVIDAKYYTNHQDDIDKLLKRNKIIPDQKIFKKKSTNLRNDNKIILKRNVQPKEILSCAAIISNNPHLELTEHLERIYPNGQLYSHIIGYMGAPSQNQINTMKKKWSYEYPTAGKTGLELHLEDQLSGSPGMIVSERDAQNHIIRTLNESPPHSGAQLTLTIDHKIQQSAAKALAKYKGSLVAIDPNNGEVLAMVNSPSFDNNAFHSNNDLKLKAINQNPNHPLFNRALKGQFPLASTIKPFIGLKALSNGIITSEETIDDHGFYQVNEHSRVFHDWKADGHGKVNLKKALMISCDTYFYQLGHKMGIDLIHEGLLEFGFGQPSGLDIPGELSGLIPNKSWKKKHKNEPWYIGDTIISSIGQGAMLTTPLQLANATAMLANHGIKYRPHIIKEIEYMDGHKTLTKPIIDHQIQTKQEHWKTITKALQDTAKYGTGRLLGQGPYEVACKTGTAQVITNDKTSKNQAKKLNDHSLLIAYAPVKKPEIAIAVIVENEHGAMNVAKQVLDDYFEANKPEVQSE
ncbi:MAG: penicillin-binding protein 2 [Candidatus Comchoanobacterales bacterium]